MKVIQHFSNEGFADRLPVLAFPDLSSVPAAAADLGSVDGTELVPQIHHSIKKYDPVASASLASAAASFIVRGKGVSRLSNMKEILSRASTLKASPAD